MRAEVEHHPFLTTTEDHRICERRQARSNLDRSTTCIVHDAVLVRPSIGIPHPADQRAVDDSGPNKSKDHGRKQATTLSNGTHDNSHSNSTELHLYGRVSTHTRKP